MFFVFFCKKTKIVLLKKTLYHIHKIPRFAPCVFIGNKHICLKQKNTNPSKNEEFVKDEHFLLF